MDGNTGAGGKDRKPDRQADTNTDWQTVAKMERKIGKQRQ
jgi:hypothetical protein